VCREIVTEAYGELKVESEVGVGTTVHVILPRAQPGEATRSASMRALRPPIPCAVAPAHARAVGSGPIAQASPTLAPTKEDS
jgi:hypothetical protein